MINLEELRALPIEERISALGKLTQREKAVILYHWPFFARENQLPPDRWGRAGCYMWIVRAGRGWGKTRTGAQTFIDKIQHEGYRYTSLCAATAAEVRDIQVKGESGIMACCPPWFAPEYRPTEKKLLWPNGAVTSFFYGSEPELSRGAQSDLIWFDEIHKYQYPAETYDNLILGLRLGNNPLALITSTPKPTRLCRELEAKKNRDGTAAAVVTVGATIENAGNLSPVFLDAIITQYQGTRLGAQELDAQILDDNPNALFKREILLRDTVDILPPAWAIKRIIVTVDPAASANEKSNHTGIIVLAEGKPPAAVTAGEVQSLDKNHYYIVDDLSRIAQPHEWGSAARIAVETYGAGNVIYESNQGGLMVEAVLKNAGIAVPIKAVRAVNDKETRAYAASAASVQGRIHLVRGNDLTALVDELCEWIPGEDSPDRLDAFVHGVNYFEETGVKPCTGPTRRIKVRIGDSYGGGGWRPQW